MEKSSLLWKLETTESDFGKEMEALTDIQTEKSQNGRINNDNNKNDTEAQTKNPWGRIKS